MNDKKKKNKQPIRPSVWLAIIVVIMVFLLIIWLSIVDTPSGV